MKIATIQLTIQYDENVTDDEAVAVCLDNIIRFGAESLPLEEYGDPQFSNTEVIIGPDV